MTEFHSTTRFVSGLIWAVIIVVVSGCQPITGLIQPSPSPTETLTPAPAAEKLTEPGDHLESLTFNGASRVFLLHVPAGYNGEDKLPLVINLHGRTANMFHQIEISNLHTTADQKLFFVVSPQAAGNPPTWLGAVPTEIGDDDLMFMDELLSHLDKNLHIDPNRIYVTGFSNGASFANRLACDFSDKIAAIAPVAGGHVGFYDCVADQPVSVIAIHGKNDPIIPYEGNDVNPTVHEWVQSWAERNGCQEEPIAEVPQPGITEETWQNCRGDTIVKLYSLDDTGHTWPGNEVGFSLGQANHELDATELIWEFFMAHPKE